MSLSKSKIIDALIHSFESELERLAETAKLAHEAATHDELKAEDKHDTQAIEASYLAQGQAIRMIDLTKVLNEFTSYRDSIHKEYSKVMPGALLEVESNGKTIHTFYAKSGGGAQITIDGVSVSVTTEESPLGEALLDASENEEVEVETKNGSRLYTVLKIS